MDATIKKQIESIITNHPVVLFMKGTADSPMCGFSMRAVQILEKLGTPFHDVNILLDDNLRQGLKDFGDWPTFPQLYVNQELIGGCDIMVEMAQTGELAQLLKPHTTH
ncbi:MAG: Grx4 family monothiol glutaredoxin [Proteobacteria bacterium]|nr:Grx4 family monothiol glutaredoxin [Pseudomonadota bacterium]NBX86759.1 Grx4 family monothiol glutaredoxin [Pseudomonadota bacterium]